MSTTMEQVVSQLQQEMFNLRDEVAAQSGLAEAAQAINNLATAQVRKDTPSLIDVNGFGRPKEFSGKEENFQQWSKKTEAFFAAVIKESEVMLEWAAEQTTEITTELVNREFLPTATNQERGVQNLELVLQQMHTTLMALTSCEAGVALLPTRGRTHWRHGGGCRNDMILQQEEGNETFCARSFLRDGALFWNSKRGLYWESFVSRYEKKLQNKMDDDIKLILSHRCREELEKHLVLNSNGLRTFEDALHVWKS